MDATPLLAGRPYKRAVPSTLPPKIAPWFVFPDSPWHSIVVETSAWTWQERYALLLEHPHLAWPLRLFGFLDDPLGVQYERASPATTNTRRGSESNMGLSAHAQHCDDDDVDGVCEVRGDDAWETEHLVPKRWPLRLIIVSIVYMLGFGASAFAYPGGPAAVTAEFGAKARVDVNAFFNMLFAFVLPWTIYHAVRDPMFVVLLRLAMVHDAATTRMLVRRYFWGSVLLGSCFLCLTVAGFIVYWDDVSEYPVWLRFASFVGFYYFTFLFAFSLLVWGLVAHLSAMLLEELSESLLPDQFFAMIDAAMQASTDAVDEDAEALELDRQLGLRLRPIAGEKRVGVDTARLGAMMSPATTRDKEHTTRVISRVVESKIRQFHQASTIVQYMFDIFRPMLMLKCATDITLLFFGLAGTLDGGHLFVSTLLVVVVSLVVVFIVLSPAAYLTSLQRDIIFDVASLRPFATQTAQRASIESMINYLLPFSRRGGVRFFGMPITPALVVQVGGLFYSLIAAANFLR